MTEPFIGHEGCGIAAMPYDVLLERTLLAVRSGLDVVHPRHRRRGQPARARHLRGGARRRPRQRCCASSTPSTCCRSTSPASGRSTSSPRCSRATARPTSSSPTRSSARAGSRRMRGAASSTPACALAFGSDAPVEDPNPFYGLHAAVTRQRADGQPLGGWRPEERITLDRGRARLHRRRARVGRTHRRRPARARPARRPRRRRPRPVGARGVVAGATSATPWCSRPGSAASSPTSAPEPPGIPAGAPSGRATDVLPGSTTRRDSPRTATSSNAPDLLSQGPVGPERRGQATVVGEVEALTPGPGDEHEAVVDPDGGSPLATQVEDPPDGDFLGRHHRFCVAAGVGHVVLSSRRTPAAGRLLGHERRDLLLAGPSNPTPRCIRPGPGRQRPRISSLSGIYGGAKRVLLGRLTLHRATLRAMARPYGDPVEVVTAPIPAQSPFIPTDAKIARGSSLRHPGAIPLVLLPGSSTGSASGGTRRPTRSTGCSSWRKAISAERRRVAPPNRTAVRTACAQAVVVRRRSSRVRTRRGRRRAGGSRTT